MKKVVLLPDIHYPEHSVKCMDLVKKFIKDFKPDEIIYQGDNLDMAVISHWNKDKKRKVELKRLREDYEGFNKEILRPIERLAPKAKMIWLEGNHENWIEQYIDKNPEVEGMIEPEICLDLIKRKYKIIPFNEVYRIGKMNVIHGYYTNRYHAAKTLDVFGENVCYAHIHALQAHSKVQPMDSKNFTAAYGLPCLCDLKPDYMKNRPSAWINGFGVMYLLPNGDFNLYPIIITNNKFIFNNKLYENTKTD